MDIILTAAVALVVARAAFKSGRARLNWLIIKQYRLVHFVTNVLVLAVIITTASLLAKVPFLDKNPFLWLYGLIFGTSDGSGTGNLMLLGTQWFWYGVFFLPVLMFALPYLAHAEELMFRAGTRSWKHGVVRSIVFGLLHLIMLIPLSAAIALSLGGIWFTYQYFKGGVVRSTVYHAAYNTIIVLFLFVMLFATN